MSADGSLSVFWGDGETRFKIAIGEFRELQEKVNGRRAAMGLPGIGPQEFSNALRTNNAWPDDVRDVLRVGMVGGGMTPAAAHRKLVLYFDHRPPVESYQTAFAVFAAAFVGAPGDEMLKKKTATTDPTSLSPSPEFTATAPS